jgi:hypothetical protein
MQSARTAAFHTELRASLRLSSLSSPAQQDGRDPTKAARRPWRSHAGALQQGFASGRDIMQRALAGSAPSCIIHIHRRAAPAGWLLDVL